MRMFPVVRLQCPVVSALRSVERGGASLPSQDLSPDHAARQRLRVLLLKQLRGGHGLRVRVQLWLQAHRIKEENVSAHLTLGRPACILQT